MAKITVKMNNEPVHDGQFITRWEDTDNRPNKKKLKAVRKEKNTEETTPRSTDENDQPRISTKMWLALRDKENPNRRELK